MTYEEAYLAAQKKLKDAEIFGAARDVRKLFCHVIGSENGIIRVDLNDDMPANQMASFDKLIARRIERQPVSHLVEKREFYGRIFEVNQDVLDPRPDTELLVDVSLEEPFDRALDLGTGTGCIVLTLIAEARAKFDNGAWGCGIEKSKAAFQVAYRNRERHAMEGPVVLCLGDWFEPLAGSRMSAFDLIVSNPPYIAADEMNDLQPEVRLYEPRIALTDEADGLTAYRKITAGAPDHLDPGGRLIVEIGPTQAIAVSDMMQSAGLTGIEVRQDLDGRDRVVLGRKPL